MANKNIQVIGNWLDANGKHIPHLGSDITYSMNVAMRAGSDGAEVADIAAINTKLSGASKLRDGATTFNVVCVRNLDAGQVPGGIL
jgi:hypothetical protein